MRSSVHYVSPHDFVVRSIESRLFIRTIEHSVVYVIIVLVYRIPTKSLVYCWYSCSIDTSVLSTIVDCGTTCEL